MSKKEIILNGIIKEYLKKNAPIGSMELKDKLDIDISASTIRVYFKKLSYEGILMQLHTSSGRVPTWSALKSYWKSQLDDLGMIRISSIDELKEWVKEFGIYCMLSIKDDAKLSEIININDRFLLIVFEDKTVVLNYNEKVEKFLVNLIGYDISKVKEISISVGLNELKKKIEQLLLENIVLKEQEEVLCEMAKDSVDSTRHNGRMKDYTNNSLFEKLDNGVYFEELVPQGYLAIKYDARIEEKDADIFCVGRANKDYNEFIKVISA